MDPEAKKIAANRIIGLLFGAGLLIVLSVGGILWYAAIRATEGAVPSTPSDAVGSSSVKLAWDASPSEKVTGYKILYGTQSRRYTNSVDVGKEATATLNGLVGGTRYYVVVLAVDAHGNQSAPSGELEIVAPK